MDVPFPISLHPLGWPIPPPSTSRRSCWPEIVDQFQDTTEQVHRHCYLGHPCALCNSGTGRDPGKPFASSAGRGVAHRLEPAWRGAARPDLIGLTLEVHGAVGRQICARGDFVFIARPLARLAQSGAEMVQTCREFFSLMEFGRLLSDGHQRRAEGWPKDLYRHSPAGWLRTAPIADQNGTSSRNRGKESCLGCPC